MEEVNLIELLDDLEIIAAKSTLDDNEYNKIKKRIFEAKKSILESTKKFSEIENKIFGQ